MSLFGSPSIEKMKAKREVKRFVRMIYQQGSNAHRKFAWTMLTLLALLIISLPIHAQDASLPPITPDNPAQVKELAVLGRGSVQDVAYSPDGRRLAVATSLGIWIYDATDFTPVRLLEAPGDRLIGLTWSPDNTQIASLSFSGILQVWDTETGSLNQTLFEGASTATAVAWSPDGENLAISVLYGGTATRLDVYDVASGEQVQLRGSQWSDDLAWSPDGQYLASIVAQSVTVWDVGTGKPVRELEGHEGFVRCLAWSPDGQHLAVGDNSANVYLWDMTVEEETPQSTFESGPGFGPISDLAWSADSATLAVSSFASVDFRDVNTLSQINVLQDWTSGMIGNFSWNPENEQLVLTTDQAVIQIWDTASATMIGSLDQHFGAVNTVAWSPDGARFASGTADGIVRVWDATATEPLFVLDEPVSAINVLAWSPDGTQLAVGSADWSLYMYDGVTGKLLFTIADQEDEVIALSWNPDGSSIAGGLRSKMTRLWNAATGEELSVLETYDMLRVTSLAWDPTGTYFASAVCAQTPEGMRCVVFIRDMATGAYVTRIGDPDKGDISHDVENLVWSPDGRKLAFDLNYAIWLADAESGFTEFVDLQASDSSVSSVAFAA
ncbi:MAG: WD40 repeat domain-containing protein, partial [Lentisphaerae bacterium]|nr:WD40 repeat domain-containing protein [Lentisphaerota bacterium]